MNRKLFFIPSLFITFFLAVLAGAEESTASFEESMDQYLAKEENVKKLGKVMEDYFRKQRARNQQDKQKKEQAKIEEQFKNPVEIDIGDSPIIGNPEAKITIVEFTDFQCPYCTKGAKTMEAVLKEYPNEVRVVFKNLPLSFHAQAKSAAQAALAAREQGKFKEMHDELFKRQKKLGEATYLEIAQELGLDMEKFKVDLKDERLAAIIQEDIELAEKLGVRGTPGFFVNGVQVRGARPLSYFKSLIDRWMKEMS